MNTQIEPATTTLRAKVFLVDDHPIVRQGLAQVLNQQEDLSVCGEAENVQNALDEIARLGPDLAVVDLSLKGANGIELIKHLKLQHPKLAIMALSMHDESVYAERALRAGARGYVMKQESTDHILDAMRRVLKGEIHVSERIGTRLLDQALTRKKKPAASPADLLSDRELEVLRLIGQGHGTRQISDMLKLNVKTIETYRAHLKRKLKLKSAMELNHYAFHWLSAETEG